MRSCLHHRRSTSPPRPAGGLSVVSEKPGRRAACRWSAALSTWQRLGCSDRTTGRQCRCQWARPLGLGVRRLRQAGRGGDLRARVAAGEHRYRVAEVVAGRESPTGRTERHRDRIAAGRSGLRSRLGRVIRSRCDGGPGCRTRDPFEDRAGDSPRGSARSRVRSLLGPFVRVPARRGILSISRGQNAQDAREPSRSRSGSVKARSGVLRFSAAERCAGRTRCRRVPRWRRARPSAIPESRGSAGCR